MADDHVDAYGNVWHTGEANSVIYTNSTAGGNGGGGGGYVSAGDPYTYPGTYPGIVGSTSGNVQGGWTLPNSASLNITWPLPGMENYYTPNSATLTPEVIKALVEKMVTMQKFGEKVIICVDDDVTTAQVTELDECLRDNGITRGVIIRGARAGTGFKGNVMLPKPEDQRIDILARIGELWAQRPDLKLTDILGWYGGADMDDEDFATATEVYFQKVTNGVFGRP